MKKFILFCFPFFLVLAQAQAQIRVVTASSDLADIARVVGGDLVQVASLSSGEQDLHLIEPRPSMVMKVKNADVIIRIGLDLDMWMDSLIGAARNDKVVFGAPGYVDASVGIPLLQVPQGKVDASMGDIHIYGNPHYWLDPTNGSVIAKNILDGFCRADPAHEDAFRKNYGEFIGRLQIKVAEWDARMKPFRGAHIVTYHNSWVYFSNHFELNLVGNIEPKPGIPPTPSHLTQLINVMKSKAVKVILVEVYFPLAGPRKVAAERGAKVVVVPSSVGGVTESKTYFDLFDTIIDRLSQALEK